MHGIPITELLTDSCIERLVQRTRNGGAEIVSLMKAGSAYFAPASSACLMVESILFNQARVVPVAVYLNGQYGLSDIFLGVPASLNRSGIGQVLELELTAEERQALHKSADVVRQTLSSVSS